MPKTVKADLDRVKDLTSGGELRCRRSIINGGKLSCVKNLRNSGRLECTQFNTDTAASRRENKCKNVNALRFTKSNTDRAMLAQGRLRVNMGILGCT